MGKPKMGSNFIREWSRGTAWHSAKITLKTMAKMQ